MAPSPNFLQESAVAKSNPSDTAEDAVIRSDKSAEPAIAASLRQDLKTMLDVCERCTRWSRQVQVAQSEMLDGLATAMAGAASSLDGSSSVNDLAEVGAKLWRAAFDEMRRRHGDLPYSLAALNFEVARAWMARLQDGLDRSAQDATPVAVVDPARLYDQARASLDQWMTQWSSMWQPRAVQPA